MEIAIIKEVASAHVKSHGDNVSVSIFNKGLRTNLITLLCQSETVEAVGTVEVFGGSKDVASNMGRAVLNLFCVAEVLGVDLSTGIERALSDVRTKLSSTEGAAERSQKAQKTEDKSTETTNSETEAAAADEKEKLGDEEKPAGAGQQANADNGASGGDEKDKKIETYRTAFKEAKLPTDVRTVWNNVVQDKDLTGPDRFILQNDKKEAEKRVGK